MPDTLDTVIANLPLKKRRRIDVSDIKIPTENTVDQALKEEEQKKSLAFANYVDKILESIKIQKEMAAQKEAKIVKSTVAEPIKTIPVKPIAVPASVIAFKPKQTKRFTSFTIDAILGIEPEAKKTVEPGNEVPAAKADPNPPSPLSLKYMQVLSEIRQKRQKRGDSLEKMTECRICGGCSFSKSKAVAANYMTQHLYTHLPVAIYSCSLCTEKYASSWKPRVINHIKNEHPQIETKNHWKFISDHRPELDDYLSSLAAQCYDSF